MSTEPDIARSAGPFNENEAIIALDFHANKAAKRGDYGCHDDLKAVVELLERMAEDRDAFESEIEALRKAGGSMVRQIMAAKESLTSLP